MSAMLELDELEPILGDNCMTPGPRPGRSQAGVIPIPKSLAVGASPSHTYCSVLGIPRYPSGMPKSLVFWSSPPNNSGFRGKIENVLEMDSAKYKKSFPVS